MHLACKVAEPTTRCCSDMEDPLQPADMQVSDSGDKSVDPPPPEDNTLSNDYTFSSPSSQTPISGLLRYLLDRLAVLSSMPGAGDTSDTSLKAEDYGHTYGITKARLLENAKLVLRPFTHGPKISKFATEASWLRDVLQNTLKEVEKKVNTVCVDFLKKQNLRLMEEAINLASGHDNDVQYMDFMLNKLRDQKVEEEKLLSELEPRYNAEMAEKEAYEAEVQRLKNLDIDELGRMEVQTKAATRIQKVWRGHKIRLEHSQELKKISKKRRELRNKKKKKNPEKKKGGKIKK